MTKTFKSEREELEKLFTIGYLIGGGAGMLMNPIMLFMYWLLDINKPLELNMVMIGITIFGLLGIFLIIFGLCKIRKLEK